MLNRDLDCAADCDADSETTTVAATLDERFVLDDFYDLIISFIAAGFQ